MDGIEQPKQSPIVAAPASDPPKMVPKEGTL
jgi:hypothetical protein